MLLIRDIPNINTIKVGRFYLKPGNVYDTISRSCRMVLHEADDRTLPLGRSGSATLVRYADKNYIVTTRHELGVLPGEQPSAEILETIRVSSGTDRLSNIPLQNCIFETSNPDQEYHDILIFGVAESWKNQSADIPYFFQLEPFSKLNRVKSWLTGYPIIDGIMDDYFENFSPGAAEEIHIKRAIVDCEMDRGFVSNAEYLKRYSHSGHRPSLDGFSGGAVFSLMGNLEDLEIVLDGIIVRGGSKDIYAVDADYLINIIERR